MYSDDNDNDNDDSVIKINLVVPQPPLQQLVVVVLL